MPTGNNADSVANFVGLRAKRHPNFFPTERVAVYRELFFDWLVIEATPPLAAAEKSRTCACCKLRFLKTAKRPGNRVLKAIQHGYLRPVEISGATEIIRSQ